MAQGLIHQRLWCTLLLIVTIPFGGRAEQVSSLPLVVDTSSCVSFQADDYAPLQSDSSGEVLGYVTVRSGAAHRASRRADGSTLLRLDVTLAGSRTDGAGAFLAKPQLTAGAVNLGASAMVEANVVVALSRRLPDSCPSTVPAQRVAAAADCGRRNASLLVEVPTALFRCGPGDTEEVFRSFFLQVRVDLAEQSCGAAATPVYAGSTANTITSGCSYILVTGTCQPATCFKAGTTSYSGGGDDGVLTVALASTSPGLELEDASSGSGHGAGGKDKQAAVVTGSLAAGAIVGVALAAAAVGGLVYSSRRRRMQQLALGGINSDGSCGGKGGKGVMNPLYRPISSCDDTTLSARPPGKYGKLAAAAALQVHTKVMLASSPACHDQLSPAAPHRPPRRFTSLGGHVMATAATAAPARCDVPAHSYCGGFDRSSSVHFISAPSSAAALTDPGLAPYAPLPATHRQVLHVSLPVASTAATASHAPARSASQGALLLSKNASASGTDGGVLDVHRGRSSGSGRQGLRLPTEYWGLMAGQHDGDGGAVPSGAPPRRPPLRKCISLYGPFPVAATAELSSRSGAVDGGGRMAPSSAQLSTPGGNFSNIGRFTAEGGTIPSRSPSRSQSNSGAAGDYAGCTASDRPISGSALWPLAEIGVATESDDY